MIHPPVIAVLEAIFGEEPLAAQSMHYFKPPSARGQAPHQDDYYLKTRPGKCVAAWMALDPADEENGGLLVVPGTQDLPVLCPHEADPQTSFTPDEVDLPEGLHPVPVRLGAGDALFFNGSIVYGSYPNSSRTRFRRSFISHYQNADARAPRFSPRDEAFRTGVWHNGSMKVRRGYRFELKPTPEIEGVFVVMAGHARFVWNKALRRNPALLYNAARVILQRGLAA